MINEQRKKISLFKTFMFIGGIFLAIYVIFYFFNPDLYTVIFHSDFTDTFMDYFNSVSHSICRDPYSIQAIYPPLCYVLYWIMGILMGNEAMEILEQYDAQQNVLRSMAQPTMIFLIYFSISLIIFLYLGNQLLKKNNCHSIPFLFLICFSVPFLFQFERANIIFISLLGTMAFFVWKDSENKYLREIALIALALSAALKIYPAIFGLILLKERRYKDSFRLVFYGILCFFIPFLFIRGGFSVIPQFIKNLIYTSTIDQAKRDGYKLSFSAVFSFIIRKINHNSLLADTIGQKLSLCIMATGIFAFPWIKERWKYILLLTCILIGTPNMSYIYTSIFLVVPLIYFLTDNRSLKRKNWIYFVLFILIFFPLPFGGWNDHNGIPAFHIYNRSFNTLQISISVLLLMIPLCVEGLYNFYKKKMSHAFIIKISSLCAFLLFFMLCGISAKSSYREAYKTQEELTNINDDKIADCEVIFNNIEYSGEYFGKTKDSVPYGKGYFISGKKEGKIKIDGIWNGDTVNDIVTISYPDNSFDQMFCQESQIYGYITRFDSKGNVFSKEWYYKDEYLSELEKKALTVPVEEIRKVYPTQRNTIFECTGTVIKTYQAMDIVEIILEDEQKNKYRLSYQNIGLDPWNYIKSPNMKKGDFIKYYATVDNISEEIIDMSLISAYLLDDEKDVICPSETTYENLCRFPCEYTGEQLSISGVIKKIYKDIERNVLVYFIETGSNKNTYAVCISIDRLLSPHYQLPENDRKKIMEDVASSFPKLGENFSASGQYKGNYSYQTDSEDQKIIIYPYIYFKIKETDINNYTLVDENILP